MWEVRGRGLRALGWGAGDAGEVVDQVGSVLRRNSHNRVIYGETGGIDASAGGRVSGGGGRRKNTPFSCTCLFVCSFKWGL